MQYYHVFSNSSNFLAKNTIRFVWYPQVTFWGNATAQGQGRYLILLPPRPTDYCVGNGDENLDLLCHYTNDVSLKCEQ